MPTRNSGHINAWFDDFDGRMDGVPDIIAETATENFVENFQREGFDGQSWRPLSFKTLKNQRRSTGRILTRTGQLQRSIRPTIVEPTQVRISAGNTKVNYARVHNEGYVGVQTIQSYTNRNFMGRGKPVQIKAHKRRMVIPQRQFMGRNRLLFTEIKSRLKNHFK